MHPVVVAQREAEGVRARVLKRLLARILEEIARDRDGAWHGSDDEPIRNGQCDPPLERCRGHCQPDGFCVGQVVARDGGQVDLELGRVDDVYNPIQHRAGRGEQRRQHSLYPPVLLLAMHRSEAAEEST